MTNDTNVRLAQRLLLFVIDSMNPKLISRWCDDGSLPGISALLENSTKVALRTHPGPSGHASWMTMATGREVDDPSRGKNGLVRTWQAFADSGLQACILDRAEPVDEDATEAEFKNLLSQRTIDDLVAALQLMETRTSDVLVATFRAPSYAHHFVARFASDSVKSKSEDHAEQILLSVYQQVDRAVAELSWAWSTETEVATMLVTPHGGCVGTGSVRGQESGSVVPGLDCTCAVQPYGMMLLSGPATARLLSIEGASLLDVLPTALELLGGRIPADLAGASLLDRASNAGSEPEQVASATEPISSGYDDKEEAIISERLRGLGYIE